MTVLIAMGYFCTYQKSTFSLENNKYIYVKEIFCLPRNWIYLLQNYFSSYAYLNDIYKTLKGIGIIKSVSKLNILLNL